MAKNLTEEFKKSVEGVEISTLEKMLRVGMFDGEIWKIKILEEMGCKKPDLTWTTPIRLFLSHCIGEGRYPLVSLTQEQSYEFLMFYNHVLVTKPWLLDVYSENQAKSFASEFIDKYLNPDESKLIKLRFGFMGKKKTLEEVGRELNITRERARQIEAKAARKIRNHARYVRLVGINDQSELNTHIDISEWYRRSASAELVEQLEIVVNEFAKKAEKTYEMLDALEGVMAELMKNPEYQEAQRAKKTLRQIQFGGQFDPDIIDMKIEKLDLSVRAYNCLSRARVCTLGDLLKMTKAELYQVRNLSQKGAEEIEEKLSLLGFKLCG